MKGQIIVLDEAHNIEDSAREAASFSVTEETLQDTIFELERLSKLGDRRVSYLFCVIDTFHRTEEMRLE